MVPNQRLRFQKGLCLLSIITDSFIPPFNDVSPFTHIHEIHFDVYFTNMGFPCGSADGESACNAGDPDLIPGLGRSTGEEKGYPFQFSGLEKSMDCTVHGITKRQTQLSNFHFHCHPKFIYAVLLFTKFYILKTSIFKSLQSFKNEQVNKQTKVNNKQKRANSS